MEHEIVLCVIPMPADLDASGQVSAGWLLSRLDAAGGVIPSRQLGGAVYLRRLDATEIERAPRPGDRVSFHARLVQADAREVQVELEVRSERRDASDEIRLLVATLTYAAIS